VTCFFVLLTVSAKKLITFVIFVRYECSTRWAESSTFTYRFFCGNVLVVSETRPSSKMCVPFVAGVTNVGERARRVGHAIAALLVTDYYITATTLMTCIKDVSSCHSTRYVSAHMMSFDIIVEKVKMFRRANFTFEHYITAETLINNYSVVPNTFLETVEFPHR